MAAYAPPIQELIDCLGRLPGIGPKSAQRVAFYLLNAEDAEAQRLAAAIVQVKERMRFCERCFNVTEQTLCAICTDERRDGHVLCVVEEPKDIVAVERTRTFKGRYHVLGGAIDHLQGVGPDQLKIKELLSRVGTEGITDWEGTRVALGLHLQRSVDDSLGLTSDPGVREILGRIRSRAVP